MRVSEKLAISHATGTMRSTEDEGSRMSSQSLRVQEIPIRQMKLHRYGQDRRWYRYRNRLQTHFDCKFSDLLSSYCGLLVVKAT